MSSFTDKLKKINLKQSVKAFSLVWGLVFIVVISITNIGIDKNFDLIKWLGNSLILFGIMVFGLLIGESISIDRQKEKVDGLFQSNLSKYNEKLKSLDSIIIYFSQFYDWFMPLDLENKKVEYLIANNVNSQKAKDIVKYCDMDDYEELKKHAIIKNGIPIGKLQNFEWEAVKEVLNGEISIKVSGASYYLDAFSLSSRKSVLEQGDVFEKQRKVYKTINRSIKIVSSVLVSITMGILTVQDFMNGNDAQAWVNLVSRVTALFTSLLSGWLGGTIDVKLQAGILGHKLNVLNLFSNAYDKKLFATYNERSKAKEEYENFIKQEPKQIENPIVEPKKEIVNELPKLEEKTA